MPTSEHHGVKMEAVLIPTQTQHSDFVPDNDGIAGLRKQLKQLGVWPDAADQILALMPHSRWQNSPLVETDYEWVPRVVEDSLQGVDIGANYPAFFQKLLTSSELRQFFLSALAARLDNA
jgi:hypothetical protein